VNSADIYNEANFAFAQKDYKRAFFLYNSLLSEYPQNKEYEMLAVISDIASENEERAIFLNDFFVVAVDKLGLEEALRITQSFISAYDGNDEKYYEVMQIMTKQEIEHINAISYDDFKNVVLSRGSFKKAFEDIRFCTKIALNSQVDFIDFITKLIENDFANYALAYLDGFAQFFPFDNQLIELYKKLEGKDSDNNFE
jgi:tetratricopeptide (TPR) repeat protein